MVCFSGNKKICRWRCHWWTQEFQKCQNIGYHFDNYWICHLDHYRHCYLQYNNDNGIWKKSKQRISLWDLEKKNCWPYKPTWLTNLYTSLFRNKSSRFEHLHLRRLTLIDNIIDSRVQFTNCHNNHFNWKLIKATRKLMFACVIKMVAKYTLLACKNNVCSFWDFMIPEQAE